MKTCAYCGTQWEGEAPICKEQGTSLPRTWSCSEGEVEAAAPSDDVLDAVRAYGDARADVAYGRATRKAIDHAWDRLLAVARIPPMDQREAAAPSDAHVAKWCAAHEQWEDGCAEAAAPSDAGLREDDRAFLAWCHERFAVVFHESPNLDWMQRLAALARQGTES